MNHDRQTHGLRKASAPPLDRMPALDGSVDSGVSVVGADDAPGFSAALHPAERGACCIVLEARRLGHGGIGRDGGVGTAGRGLRPSQVRRVPGRHAEPRPGAAGPSRVFGLIERDAIGRQATRLAPVHRAEGRAHRAGARS